MYPDLQTRLKLDAQLEKCHNTVGMFGINVVVIARDEKHPGNFLINVFL